MKGLFCANWMIFILALLVTGCSTVHQAAPVSTPPAQTLSWEERQNLLSQIKSWEINGKIAVHTAQDSGSATVNWLENHGAYIVSLYGPLGAGSMKLAGKPGHVTLETSDGKLLTANNPESLLVKGWGFNLPVSHLNYWVRGLPVPGISANTRFDNEHRLTNLVQQGWHVQYLDYSNTHSIDLPSKISISSSTLSSKIIIYDWKIKS